MIKHENQCVGCPTEMGCLGGACPYADVEVCVCNECGDYAEYSIDGDDYCEKHAKDFLVKEFNKLDITERAEILDLYLTKIDT